MHLFLIFCESAFSQRLLRTKKFAVNKQQNTNYSFLPVTSKVSCKRRKRGQIICLQGNNKSMVIFVLKRRKSGTISCLMWNIYLYFIILKLFINFQNIIFLVKIGANAPLRIDLNFYSVHEEINSNMWLRKGVYHIFEFISNEPNKKLWSILIN